MTLATTVALPVLRGPVQLAKALVALDVLSEGRVVAGVGPGSSERDYELAGIPFARALAALRRGARRRSASLLEGEELAPGPHRPGRDPALDRELGLARGPGSRRAGRRRLARVRVQHDARALRRRPRPWPARSPPAGGSRTASRRRSRRCGRGSPRTAPRPTGCSPGPSPRSCDATPKSCASRSASAPPRTAPSCSPRYAAAGCERVYLWPLGDERRQLELIAEPSRRSSRAAERASGLRVGVLVGVAERRVVVRRRGGRDVGGAAAPALGAGLAGPVLGLVVLGLVVIHAGQSSRPRPT